MDWRRHQREALAALDRQAGTRSRLWVVLPPGAGKTALGCQWAAATGRPVVVFSPNLAIAEQWIATWNNWFADPAEPSGQAGRNRDLSSRCTALTYQALAVFHDDAEMVDDGASGTIARLHENGRALVEKLATLGPVAIVLDECHHLLHVWGQLLAEVLAQLPDAVVLGLTATPPLQMTRDESALVEKLFGGICYQASIAALVCEGDLVPFAELAWLTTPTPAEHDWLVGQAAVWEELLADLLDPLFGVEDNPPGAALAENTGLLPFIDLQYGEGGVPWNELVVEQPALADALLRLNNAGFFELPSPDIVLRAQNRLPPTVDDWMCLVAAWVKHGLTGPNRASVLRRLREALPGVGYQLTSQGEVRPGPAPADRLLAFSAAKADAAASIVSQTLQSWPDARILILCDFDASTVVASSLRKVMGDDAGSAARVLDALLRDPVASAAGPLLVSRERVVGPVDVMGRLAALAAEQWGETARPDAQVVGQGCSQVSTSEPGRWAALVSQALSSGLTHVLIGTRTLLGEGWDARPVTCVIDLTSATSVAAVTQTRGRALRKDPANPDKVAVNWTVAAGTSDHPLGGRDYQRLVRKHAGWFATDAAGDVVAGVAHCDSVLDELVLPPEADFDAINARGLIRGDDRAAIADAWARIGPEPAEPVAALDIVWRGAAPATTPAEENQLHLVGGTKLRLRSPTARKSILTWPPVTVILAVGFVIWLVTGRTGQVAVIELASLAPVFAGVLCVRWVYRHWRVLLALRAPNREPGLDAYGCAVADALHWAGLTSAGSEALRVEAPSQGIVRLTLEVASEAESLLFADSLDELLARVRHPRYVALRGVLPKLTTGVAAAMRASTIGVSAGDVLAYSVPSVLAASRDHADLFGKAWSHWVCGGQFEPQFVRGSESEALFAPFVGTNPVPDVGGTRLRRQW